MTDHAFEGLGDWPLFPGGIGQMLQSILGDPEQQPCGPYVHTFQQPEPPDGAAPLPWIEPDIDLTGMSWEEAQRHASIGFCRTMMHADRQMFMGAACEPPTWAEAEAFYERVQAEQRREDGEGT